MKLRHLLVKQYYLGFHLIYTYILAIYRFSNLKVDFLNLFLKKCLQLFSLSCYHILTFTNRFSMPFTVGIYVSYAIFINMIFSSSTPSTGQTIGHRVKCHIWLKSVLTKLSEKHLWRLQNFGQTSLSTLPVRV